MTDVEQTLIAQLRRGYELLRQLDAEKRHPITVDHNDDLSSLTTLVVLGTDGLMQQGNLPGAIESAKTLIETVFVLGFRAGEKAEREKLDESVWDL